MEGIVSMSNVSIIVPVYNLNNSGEYLPRCVNSLINQTYRNLEIILVDDGSTDGTDVICDKLAESDSRIKVLHKANGGVSSARNTGIEAAGGEFITFVDADDYAAPDHIESLLGLINQSGCDVAVCSFISEHEDKCSEPVVCSDSTNKECISYNHNSAVCVLLAGGAVGGYVWNKLYRRELLQGIRFRCDIKILEDLCFNFEVFKRVKNVSFTSYKSYHYIQRGQSAMHRRFGDEHRKMVATAREIRDELAGESSELVDAGNGLLATTILWVSDVMAEYGPYDEKLFREYREEFKPLRKKYMKMSRIPLSYRASALFFSMGFGVFRFAVRAVRKIM